MLQTLKRSVYDYNQTAAVQIELGSHVFKARVYVSRTGSFHQIGDSIDLHLPIQYYNLGEPCIAARQGLAVVRRLHDRRTCSSARKLDNRPSHCRSDLHDILVSTLHYCNTTILL